MATQQSLTTIGLNPDILDANHYVRLLNTVLNWSHDAGWKDRVVPECDPTRLIREQLLDYGNAIDTDEKGIWLGQKRVKTLSAKRTPDHFYFGSAKSYLGDLLSGTRGIRQNALISLTIHYPDAESTRARQEGVRQFITNQDSYFCLPFFLNCLPFGAERGAIADLKRYRTLATRHAIPLLPLFGDWAGTGTPTLNFVSRNGEHMAVSLFDTTGNYNLCIAAESGKGKSFLTNEIIVSYLTEGAQIWTIDVGRSYEKLCEVLEGDFVKFNHKFGDLPESLRHRPEL
jgi:hypothetical protein